VVAVLLTKLAACVLGVPPSSIVDQAVPLDDLWGRDAVDRMMTAMSRMIVRQRLSMLVHEATRRIQAPDRDDVRWIQAPRIIQKRRGNISIDAWARHEGISRRQFSRRFTGAAGLPPKLFARITRFQSTVHAMLATDVSEWVSISTGLGFYDQAHMINEFREFAGQSPTRFFRPHDDSIDPARIQPRGRPGEWLQPAAR